MKGGYLKDKMNGRIMKTDQKFFDSIKDIKLERVRKGIDKKFKGDIKITEAISRHNLFPQIKKDVIGLDFKKLR